MSRQKSFATEADERDYMWDCVHTDSVAIQEEYIRVPADLAYWNERYASAYKRWLELKAKRDRTYADLWVKQLQDADAAGLKKPSAADVEQAIEREEAYASLKVKLVGAEGEKVRLWGVLDAIRRKADMVVSLGAHVRHEMEMTRRGESDGGAER